MYSHPALIVSVEYFKFFFSVITCALEIVSDSSIRRQLNSYIHWILYDTFNIEYIDSVFGIESAFIRQLLNQNSSIKCFYKTDKNRKMKNIKNIKNIKRLKNIIYLYNFNNCIKKSYRYR